MKVKLFDMWNAYTVKFSIKHPKKLSINGGSEQLGEWFEKGQKEMTKNGDFWEYSDIFYQKVNRHIKYKYIMKGDNSDWESLYARNLEIQDPKKYEGILGKQGKDE